IVVVMDEPTTKLAALTAGEVDFAGIQPAHAAFVRKNAALTVLDYPLIYPYGIVFNTRIPPFDDARVRLAVALALDRREIVDGYLYGFGSVADGPVPPAIPGYVPVRPVPTEPDSARRLLGGRRIAFELLTLGSGGAALGQRRAHGRAGRVADGGRVADRAVKRRDLPTEFHATAPVRLDFAGGWTDVPPFSAREGGVVVNGAIELTARVAVRLGGRLIRLVSEDLGEKLECADSGGLVLDGRLDLLKAALRMLPVQAACTITTRCDAPPGSGLGSS